jgi:predicted nucleic acid-binding protein
VKRYIFDACALIAIANNERGADAVQELIRRAEAGEAVVCINVVNLFEVCYKLIQQKGIKSADTFIKSVLYASPIKIIDTIDIAVFREAARFKTAYKISLADSFALASAFCTDGVLVTADHHELDTVEQSGDVQFFWIR